MRVFPNPVDRNEFVALENLDGHKVWDGVVNLQAVQHRVVVSVVQSAKENLTVRFLL